MKIDHMSHAGRRITEARPTSHLLERIIPATLPEGGMERVTGKASDVQGGAKAFVEAVATLLKSGGSRAAAAETMPSSTCASDLTAAQVLIF